jgi:protocatechuate 3,4-dioxygenase beta subunit
LIEILGIAGLGGWQLPALGRVLEPAEAAPAPTPRLTDGPFYPPAFAPDPSASLIVGPMQAQARPLRLAGRVVDRSGRPLSGSRVEIWQCDARRHYHHPADGPADARDAGFRGYGWQAAGADGQYAFETIRPVAYPGRTPHIHVKVKVDGRAVLTSQIFMPDEADANAHDFLWRSLGNGQPLALATLDRREGREIARFDIVPG